MNANTKPMRAISLGECMLEITGSLGGEGRLAYGGDTFNTAYYLCRLGLPTEFATALGIDTWSRALIDAWRRDGIGTRWVLTDPDRRPGVYAVATAAQGERSFTYWREASAARNLFALAGIDALLEAIKDTDLLFLSGITLSLYDAQGRSRIRLAAEALRARGGVVAFDPNYRPMLWPSAEVARSAIAEFAGCISIVLPTYDDEKRLWGDANVAATAERWHADGVCEVVVKLGATGAFLSSPAGQMASTPPEVVRATDTTGAGDSFNAGYLFHRLQGKSPSVAALHGHSLAAIVITQPGAIVSNVGGSKL